MSVWQRLKEGMRELAVRGGGAACPAIVRPALSRLEHDLWQRKTELGDLVYSRYRDGEPCNGRISRLCREIAVLDAALHGLAATRGRGNSLARCPICCEPQAEESFFCKQCGAEVSRRIH